MTTQSQSAQTLSNRQYFLDILFLILALGLFYALWLGSHALFTPDEGRYSEVAREMLVSHDLITPRLNGVVFLDKPILYYWLQASAMYLFGIKEWTLRLWPALIGVLGCIITYIAGHLLFNRRTGILSAVILSTSPLYYGAAHYANLDLEVASLISISLMSFIVAMNVHSDKTRTCFLFFAYTFSALAALTKGLIGIAFPSLIIGAWIVLSGRWDTLKKMRLVSGLFLFCAITLPWYVLVQKANPEFFQFFFIKQQVSRFLTTENFNNRTPIWFYVPIVLGGLFPWCVFIVLALRNQLKKIWQNRFAHAVELYLVLWVVIIFLFFSIPKSKTIGYILPIFPALALILGKYINDSWSVFSKDMKNCSWIFVLLALGGAITSFALPYTHVEYSHGLNPYLTLNGILLATSAGLVGFFLLTKPSSIKIISTIALTSILFLLILAACSHVITEKSIKPLAIHIRPNLQKEDEVIAFFRYFQDLPIYLERRITIVADWNAKDIPMRDNWVRELWYGMPFQDTKEWLINEDNFWQRWNSSKRLYVFTDQHYFKSIQQKSTKPVFKVAEYNDTVLLTNKPTEM